MLEKGDMAAVKITDMSDRGQGIGHSDGITVFAAGAVFGDTARIRITNVKKRFVSGTAEEITEKSPYRREPECPYASVCGGCAYQELSEEGQRILKEKQVRDKLERLGGLEDPVIHPIVRPEHDTAYRNKAVFHIEGPSVGFMERGTHNVFDCRECMLQLPPAAVCADVLRDFLKNNGKAGIRTMTVRTSDITKEVMVIFSVRGKGLSDAEELIESMDEAVYEAGFSLESVYIEETAGKGGKNGGRSGKQSRPGKLRCIAGKPVIRDRIGELDCEIGPDSFMQVNPFMTEKMYGKVREYAGLSGSETLLDIYCGTGTIGLFCAKDTGFILGIEQNHQAVLDANRNAVINGITAARYIEGKAEEVLPDLLEAGTEEDEGKYDEQLIAAAESCDVVILDPPRAGCRTELLDAAAKADPERIVYMSCDPATLARDIKYLSSIGYEFAEAVPFDNFSGTAHVEVVTLLVRKSQRRVRGGTK